MKNQNKKIISLSRRQFIGRAAAAVGGFALASGKVIGAPAIIRNLGKPNSKFGGVQIGAITYSWRSLPTNAEQVLKYCVDCNVSALELMGPTAEAFAGAPHMSTEPMVWGAGRERPSAEERAARAKEIAAWRTTVSMDKFEQLRKMYKDAGVSIYAFKPSALEEDNTDAEIEYALRAAKALGASHVTVELPKNGAQSKRLGELAAKHKVVVAYHGHLQQTITSWDEAISQSKYNGANCDVGHYVAAGFDPIALLKSKHDHILSMHLKDRKSKENGGDNVRWGEGDTPIVEILQLMKKEKYKFPATVELEYKIPEGSDALKETAKCVEYCRKALEKTT
ncbi:MAG: sugar phosphate isomerase/epimerase [Bacteroidota bacterium]|nr:sugar phosphate isomerase/epimerase [Bacteroidota bacterium]